MSLIAFFSSDTLFLFIFYRVCYYDDRNREEMLSHSAERLLVLAYNKFSLFST